MTFLGEDILMGMSSKGNEFLKEFRGKNSMD